MPNGIEARPKRGQVAIVDDDDLFRESLETNLLDSDFDVVTFARGETALESFDKGDLPGLVLLDWKMPGLNGIEVLRQMRSTGNETPVIFLTVLGDQIYEEAALSSGAVDFVEKSRSFSILLRRIGLILDGSKSPAAGTSTDSNGTANEPLNLGHLELNLESNRAAWRGVEVSLSLTEFRMVHYLASRVGLDVRYRDLYDLVHGEGFVAGSGDDGFRTNVRTFIRRVRKKFREADNTFDAIENYPGFGYRWRDDAGGNR